MIYTCICSFILLLNTGQLVAVKVQRPDALETAAVDMYILRKGAAFFKQYKVYFLIYQFPQ